MRRIYYGWYVVGACGLIAIMTWGIGVFNPGVFFGFFNEKYGWSPTLLSSGAILFHVWSGVAGVVVGRLIDRRGPREILIAGSLTLGAGTIVFGLAQQSWHIFPAFLLLATGFACLHTVTIGKVVAIWFIRHRRRAMASATIGAGIGGMTLPLLNATLLERWGGPAGGFALAIIAVAIIIPLAIWVIKDSPAILGLQPDGETGPVQQEPSEIALDGAERWTITMAMRTPTFWALAISLHLGMIAQSGFLLHQILFLQPKLGFLGAVSVVSITALAGTVSRIGFALLGNRWHLKRVTAGVFILQAAGLLISAFATSTWTLILGSAMFGASMSIVVILQPVLTAECFGQRSFGQIYGPIYLGIRIGAAVGPLVFGVISEAAGSYRPVLVLVAAGLLLAVIVLHWANPLTQGQTSKLVNNPNLLI